MIKVNMIGLDKSIDLGAHHAIKMFFQSKPDSNRNR